MFEIRNKRDEEKIEIIKLVFGLELCNVNKIHITVKLGHLEGQFFDSLCK